MTIGEYFGDVQKLMADRDVLIGLVTDGAFDLDTSLAQRFPYWEEFMGCILAAVKECAAFEFQGRYSCAQVMGVAMGKFKQRDKSRTAPGGWYPTMKQLRASPGQPTYVRPAEPVEMTAEEMKEFFLGDDHICLMDWMVQEGIYTGTHWQWMHAKMPQGTKGKKNIAAWLESRGDCPEELKAMVKKYRSKQNERNSSDVNQRAVPQ
jgi:hypothetical protein